VAARAGAGWLGLSVRIDDRKDLKRAVELWCCKPQAQDGLLAAAQWNRPSIGVFLAAPTAEQPDPLDGWERTTWQPGG